MIERPQHYVFRLIDNDVASFQAANLQFQLDSDAPFRLMGMAIVGYLNAPAFTNMRFTRPDRSWMQRYLIPFQAINPYTADASGASGTTAHPSPFILASPISPNLLYPPNAVIVMDFQNVVGTFSGITAIVFVGTKIFQDGAVWSPTYPVSYNSLPFLDYNLIVAPPAFGAAPLLQVPFDIQPDADFVWQAGQHSSQSTFATLFFGHDGGQLMFTAVTAGSAGNSISVTVTGTGGGPSAPFSISVVGDAISVQLATNGASQPITTVAQAVAALNSDPAVAALVTVSSPSPPGIVVADTGGVALFLSGGSDVGLSGGIGIRIRDYTGKYYSNDYVPVELLFGFDHAQVPGLVYPEIYVPKNQALYFDFATLSNNLSTPVGQLVLAFKGMKIYG
jgi:hypothetical protein